VFLDKNSLKNRILGKKNSPNFLTTTMVAIFGLVPSKHQATCHYKKHVVHFFLTKNQKQMTCRLLIRTKLKKTQMWGLGFQAQLPLGFCIKAKNVGLVNKRLTIFGPLIFC
jgi:hypothetical protein